MDERREKYFELARTQLKNIRKLPAKLGILSRELTRERIIAVFDCALEIEPMRQLVQIAEIRDKGSFKGSFLEGLNLPRVHQEAREMYESGHDIILVMNYTRMYHCPGAGYPLVWASTSPINFAHEIGHVFGLWHPEACYEDEDCYEVKRANCNSRKYVMGCAFADGITEGFSPEDMQKLMEVIRNKSNN